MIVSAIFVLSTVVLGVKVLNEERLKKEIAELLKTVTKAIQDGDVDAEDVIRIAKEGVDVIDETLDAIAGQLGVDLNE